MSPVRACPLFLTVWLGLVGCITDRQLLRTYRKSDAYRGFAEKLQTDGTYRNLDAGGTSALTREILPYTGFRSRDPVRPDSGYTVRLQRAGDRWLAVSVRSSDSQLYSTQLKVREKEGYLSLRRQSFFLPVPLFFFHREHKAILLTDTAGHLVSVSGKTQIGWVLFLVAGSEGQHARRFAPL